MAVIVDRVVDRASIIDAIPSMRGCLPRGGGVELVIDRFCHSRERHKATNRLQCHIGAVAVGTEVRTLTLHSLALGISSSYLVYVLLN
jgi:hypothetical protein